RGRIGASRVSDLKAILVSGHVPDLDGGVRSTGRNKPTVVGAEGHTRYRVWGPLEGVGLLPGGWVVDGNPVWLADGEEPAVRAERDAGRPLGEWNRTPFGQRVSLVGA